MPTVALNAISKAYPFITNRIKASVRQETGGAIIASIIDTTSGHPQRVWSFSGLPRNNYQFSLDEIDGGGSVVNNLALFSVVPGQVDGLLCRDDEQIRVGTTPGFVTGATSAIFDGTSGKPNYIGWEIVPSELTGRGILVRELDYSWDKITGVFSLLITDDTFPANIYYNIHFDPVQNPIGNSYPTITDFGINLITADTVLDDSYFAKKLIVEPSGNYVKITLPDISTIPQGRKMMVEIGGTGIRCAKFLPNGADTINFLDGILIANSGESFSIYAYARPASPIEWRVCDTEGNFKKVGLIVSADHNESERQDMKLLNGDSLNKFKYSRLFEEVVSQLPLVQVCDYDVWSTGNNKYLYSFANSSDPGHADEFHIPDRRGLFEQNNKAGKAGDYDSGGIGQFTLILPLVQHTGSAANFGVTDGPLGAPDHKDFIINTGVKNRPENYLTNKYVLI
jgi:hypothetical protein